MKKQVQGIVEAKLSRFLLSYRTTPQTTTWDTCTATLGAHTEDTYGSVKT
jgi:hypothetical protein